MRIVFMGTPDFAAAPLKSLIQAGHDVCLVVTQPDRAKGRNKEPVPSPVKVCALSYGIPVYQPERIKTPEAVSRLKDAGAELFVVAAYGQILSQEILDIPARGCVNVHASLLPKLRGASPIQGAILNGDKTTGVTIMQMDAGMDTGDMLSSRSVDVDPSETAGTLFDKLSPVGADLLVRTLEEMEKGTLKPVRQDPAEATYTPLLKKETGRADWQKSAEILDRESRAFSPWPGLYTTFRGKKLKIAKAEAVRLPDLQKAEEPPVPGTVLGTDSQGILVACGDGCLKITVLQLEGKKEMPAAAFLRGTPVKTGEKLGE